MHIQPIPISADARYTLYSISDGAMTERMEITVVSVLETPEWRPLYSTSTKGKWRLGTYKIARRRGEFHLDLKAHGTLVIPGSWHGIPCDHERWASFAMAATMNLAAEPDEIRELVRKNINSNFSEFDRIVAYPKPLNHAAGENGILVYPEVPTSHAVVLRMRESLSKEAE